MWFVIHGQRHYLNFRIRKEAAGVFSLQNIFRGTAFNYSREMSVLD